MKKNQPNYKYEHKSYLHLDGRRKYNKKTESYVNNVRKIKSHGFYPLIKFNMTTEKYDLKNAKKLKEITGNIPIKTSTRTIMFASHIDNFIYKYYADILNEKY